MAAEKLAEAIDDLLTVDPRSLSDVELHKLVVTDEREASRYTAARARLLAEWESRRTWGDDGCKSPAIRLARDCGASPKTARRELRRARKLRFMPGLAAAFAAGVLHADVVDLLADAYAPELAACYARDEEMLLANLAWMRYAEAERYVARWRQVVDEEADRKRRDREAADRHGHSDRTIGGGINVSAFLPALEGTPFLEEHRRLEQMLYDHDVASAKEQWGDDYAQHLGRTARQRGADALIEMATRSAAMPAGTRLPVPLYTILCGHDTAAQALCQLEDGTVLHPRQMVPRMTEAEYERVVFGSEARVIEVGRRTRFFTGALRRAIQVRDRYCKHESGCDEPLSRCQVHHKNEYEDGGETTQENGELHCGFHNRWKHRNKKRRPPSSNDGGEVA